MHKLCKVCYKKENMRKYALCGKPAVEKYEGVWICEDHAKEFRAYLRGRNGA